MIFDCNNENSNALLLQCVPTSGSSLEYSQLPLYGQICVCDADFEKGCDTASQFSKRGGVTDTSVAPTSAPTFAPTPAPTAAPTAAPFIPEARESATTTIPDLTGKSATRTKTKTGTAGTTGKTAKTSAKTHHGKKKGKVTSSMSAAKQGGVAAAAIMGVGVVGVGMLVAARRVRMQRGYTTLDEDEVGNMDRVELNEDMGLLM